MMADWSRSYERHDVAPLSPAGVFAVLREQFRVNQPFGGETGTISAVVNSSCLDQFYSSEYSVTTIIRRFDEWCEAVFSTPRADAIVQLDVHDPMGLVDEVDRLSADVASLGRWINSIDPSWPPSGPPS